MAKKNIMTDFNSLKGKLSFSENSSVVADVAPAPKKESAKAEPASVLKAGQRVVLMDSDLRGKIVSLGKEVNIELEDGFIIKAAYGEFAVTQDAEVSALKQSKAAPMKTSRQCEGASMPVSRPGAKGRISVDLHIEALPGGRSVPKGQRLQFQMETFKRVINENLPHRGTKIEFIHGHGDGVLKTAIRKELDEVLALRCSYSVGDPAVTVVSIK